VRLFLVTVDDGRRKEFDNCSLFRNLVFISAITEIPTSQMYEDEKGSSTFKASVERVGHVCLKKITFQKIFATRHKSARDPPVQETRCSIV
jgi:hypothetical protein